VEFALAIAGHDHPADRIWVLPFVASLHAQLAATLLGTNTTAQLHQAAGAVAGVPGKGVDAAEAERRPHRAPICTTARSSGWSR